MTQTDSFDVIIVGGSYSGLAAAMALGRALRKILVIDSGKPCNRQTPHSHNFLTQDGKIPGEITAVAKKQVASYDTVQFLNGWVTKGTITATGFEIQTGEVEVYTAKKIILATGIKDIMQAIPGYAECWGISVLHCPYCHGYEVRGQKTGILANGDYGYELCKLISNWTQDLMLFTNGKSTLTNEQTAQLKKHNIQIEEAEIEKLEHSNGYLNSIYCTNGITMPLKNLYARSPFVQHSDLAGSFGCEITSDGYIKVDNLQKTTIPGVFASGDNTTRIRTVANAIAMGTTAGMMANKELIEETF